MEKRMISILIASFLMIVLVGCSQLPTGDESITITDSVGTEVVIEKIPERMIALLPSDVEILYALGVGDKIVAVGEYSDFPEDVMNKKKLGSGDNTNIEEIIALEPDMVFMGKMEKTEARTEQLRNAGISVIVTSANTIEEAFDVIGMIGQAVGKTQDANQIVNEMKSGFDELKEKAELKEKVRAYVEVSPLQFGLFTCGQGTYINELMEIVGIENEFAEIEGWGQISEEQIIEKNPEVILTTVGSDYGIENPVEDILSRENWQNIDAVVEKKVYQLEAAITARPGPRLLDAAKQMYQLVYGE